METHKEAFAAWKKVQLQKDSGRSFDILSHAASALENNMGDRYTLLAPPYSSEEVDGFSYSLKTEDALKLLNPKLIGLFQELWSAATMPSLGPDNMICHIVRGMRTNPTAEEFISPRQPSQYAITYIFNEFGIAKVSWRDEAEVMLHPGQIWQPRPMNSDSFTDLVSSINGSPETRNNLALMMAREASKPAVLRAARPIAA